MPDDRKYYVVCQDKCLFEAMTKEQTIAAIAEATGKTPTEIDEAFITKIKEQNRGADLQFWVGTQAEYNAIEEPDPNTYYILTDRTSDDEISSALSFVQTYKDEIIQYVNDYKAEKEKKNKVLFTNSAALKVGDSIPDIRDYSIFRVYFDPYDMMGCLCERITPSLMAGTDIISGMGIARDSSEKLTLYIVNLKIVDYSVSEINVEEMNFNISGGSVSSIEVESSNVVRKIIGII